MGGCNSKGDVVQERPAGQQIAANEAPASGGGNEKEVQKLLEQGNNAFREQSWDAALKAYQQVVEIRKKSKEDADLATALVLVGNAHLKAGQYKEGLKAYQDALEVRKRVAGEKSEDTAESYRLVCVAHVELAQYTEALAAGEKALGIFEATHGNEHAVTVQCMADIANCYKRMNNYAKAHEMWAKILPIRQKILKEDSPVLHETFHSIGQLFIDQQQFAKALEFIERAHDLREKHLPAGHPDIALSMIAKGIILGNSGKSTQAISLVEDAIESLKKSLGSTDPSVGNGYMALADIYLKRKDQETALQHMQTALGLFEKGLGPNDLVVAATLFRLGELCLGSDQMQEKSKQYLERCLKIRADQLGPDDVDTLRAQLALGRALGGTGAGEDALRFYQEVARIHKESKKETTRNHLNRADALQNLGRLHFDRHEFADAIAAYEEARPLYALNCGDVSKEMGTVGHNMGIAYKNAGDGAKALQMFQGASAVRKELYERDKDPEMGADLGTTLGQIATLYDDAGEHEKAAEAHRQAFEVRKKALGEEDRQTATSAFMVGRALRKLERNEEALEILRAAKECFVKASGPDSEDVAVVTSVMAELSADLGNAQESIKLYEEVARIREKTQPGSQALVKVLHNIGVLYGSVGDHEASAVYHRRSTMVTQQAGGRQGWKGLFNEAVEYLNAGQYDKAIHEFDHVLKMQLAALGPENEDTILTFTMLASAFADKKQYDKATEMYGKALKGQEQLEGPESRAAIRTVFNLAVVSNSAGDREQAVAHYKRALAFHVKEDELSDMVGKIAYELGGLQKDLGDPDGAMESFALVAKVWEKTLGSKHENLGTLFYTMAEICFAHEKWEDASGWYFRAAHIWEETLGEEHENMGAVCYNLGESFKKAEDFGSAVTWYERAYNIFRKLHGLRDPKTEEAKEQAELMKWKAED